MNIQFGHFIELLMTNLINKDSRYEILDRYSGKKSNNFRLSKSNGERILPSLIIIFYFTDFLYLLIH